LSTETLALPAVAEGAGSPEIAISAVPDILLALAHELRGVLGPLKVATDLLTDPTTVGPPDLAYITAVMSEGVRWLEGLSEALVACALVRCQNLNLQVQEFSPQEWARSVFQLADPLLARRGQQVRLHCPNPELRIQGDPRWLGHVLLNLLSNAIRYGPAGDLIEVGVTGEAERIRISVTNHGTRTDAESNPADGPVWPPRMGVGLQVAGLIAALHGGTLGAALGTGQGAVFWVDLPTGVKGRPGEEAR
jgi:signal transduction histidine kinase